MNRPTVSAPRRSGVALAGLAAVAATTLSGCMYFSPAQTDASYIPSDGTISHLGDVQLSNVLVVASAKGSAGQLEGLATNNSQQEVKLTVAPTGGSSTTVTIPALTSVRLDGKSSGDSTATVQAVSVAKVPVAPGEQMTINFSVPSTGQNSVQVPVLLDQPPYGSASPSHPDN